MSHHFYGKEWSSAQVSLTALLQQEATQSSVACTSGNRFNLAGLTMNYVKYVLVMNKLQACDSQIVHPQKRRILRLLLDATIGRILEIKQQMINSDFSEFHYFDDILADLKLLPSDVELSVPAYFTVERRKTLQERAEMLNSILSKLEQENSNGGGGGFGGIGGSKMSSYEAVLLIQRHERARQGRTRATFMEEIHLQEQRESIAAANGPPPLSAKDASTKIQRMWKGYAARRWAEKERREEMKFLGMTTEHGQFGKRDPAFIQCKHIERMRHEEQERREIAYQEALVATKQNIKKTEAATIQDTLRQQIRQWFIECRETTGRFPDYPTEEEGGSLLLFVDKDPAELEREKLEKEASAKKGSAKKKGNKKGKKERGKKSKKGKDKKDMMSAGSSKFIKDLQDGTDTYASVWKFRDESKNISQHHDVELIKEEKRLEVEADIRLQVDHLMRAELKSLKLAVDKDKKFRNKADKKKKKATSKKSAKKRSKSDKLTDVEDRSVESMFEELVMEGIIVKPQPYRIDDYLGEYGYLSCTLRDAQLEPMPSLADIRRAVIENAILPMGSPVVHNNAPLVKSILLAGPHGTGKHMLVHCICNELGATLFDLSAETLKGKYPGKEGLKILMSLVMKLARELQPSIFVINDCEKMFRKKPARMDNVDHKRLKKDVAKLLKMIRPEDRMLLIGLSRTPYDGDMKSMAQIYQKMFVIPRPDYSSRRLLWRTFLQERGLKHFDQELDVSSLAKVTDGFTSGDILFTCKQVLTEQRALQLTNRPLTALELVNELAKLTPVFKDEEEALASWYAKTPLARRRNEKSAAAVVEVNEEKNSKKKPNFSAKSRKRP